jgi:hypothetical protein
MRKGMQEMMQGFGDTPVCLLPGPPDRLREQAGGLLKDSGRVTTNESKKPPGSVPYSAQSIQPGHYTVRTSAYKRNRKRAVSLDPAVHAENGTTNLRYLR